MSEQAATSPLPTEEIEAPAEAAALVDVLHLTKIIEAALLTSQDALSPAELKKLSDVPLDSNLLEELLGKLGEKYADSGIELTRVASGWRFRARPEMQQYLGRLNPQKPPRYSRAVMETLAIIAYRQPVTRGDIEDIRGVAVSPQIMKTLETRGWIEVIGNRDVPGRPELFATTKQMLDDMNLRSLQELPSLDEIGSLLEQEEEEADTNEPVIAILEQETVEVVEAGEDISAEAAMEAAPEVEKSESSEQEQISEGGQGG